MKEYKTIYVITRTKGYGATGEDPESNLVGAYTTRESALERLEEIEKENLDLQPYDEDGYGSLYSINQDEDSITIYEIQTVKLREEF